MDRRWFVALPMVLLAVTASVVGSYAHISKSAGTCAVRHPAFCSSRALQAPVNRDIGRDNRLSDRAQAVRLATAAVHMIPVDAVALRNLGLAERDSAAAQRLMMLSNKLSRRDGVTEGWLIERALRRGDLNATLVHSDALLRTMPVPGIQYMQQMGVALGNREFRQLMEPYARIDNPWFGPLGAAIMSDNRPVRFYGQYLAEVDKVPDSPQQRLHYDEVLTRLAAERHFDVVRALYPRLPGAERAALTSAALPTSKQVPYRPVTWALQSDGAIGSELAREGGPGLVVYAEPDASGTVASKMLFLRPGSYRLHWQVKSDAIEFEEPSPAGDGLTTAPRNGRADLRWTVECAGPQSDEIADVSAAPSDGRSLTTATAFVVPVGCAAQSLKLNARVDRSGVGMQWTVSDIAVRAAGSSDRR